MTECWHAARVKIDSRPGRLRGRYLAGDEHTGVWVRRRNREQRLHVLRSLWRSFVLALVVGGAVLAGVAVLIPWSFVRGLVVGAGAAALLSLMAYLILALSGTVATGMGATAEAWTAAELRRLRKHGWRVINGLSWQGRDVDHILIGPGGILVVETKWSADGWNLTSAEGRVGEAIDQAVSNARTLRLWGPVKTSGAEVHPVVILWGGNRKGSPQRQDTYITAGEAVIAYGIEAVGAWIDVVVRQPTTTTPDTTARLWDHFATYIANREHADGTAAPPLSIDRLLWTGVAAALIFVLTVVGCLNAFARTDSWWVGVATICAALAAFLVARRRWPAIRVPIGAGLLGLAVVSTIAATSAVASAIG